MNISFKFFRDFFIRFAALGLVTVCAFQARAAWAFYQGQQLAAAKQYPEALQALEKADLNDPDALKETGEVLKKLPEKDRDLQKQFEIFEKLGREVPVYGKAWMEAALKEYEIAERKGEEISREKWGSIWEKAKQGLLREPYSAWMMYSAATLRLAGQKYLSGEQRRRALGLLRRSILAHDPSQPPRYLKPALDFLWKQEKAFHPMLAVTPPDEVGYKILLDFLEEKNIWQFREEAAQKYRELKETQVKLNVKEGKDFLTARNFEKALEKFQRAFWYDQQNQQFSLTGMLASQGALEKLPEDFRPKLRTVLESEDPELKFFLPFLEPAVKTAADPYIQALYEFRRSNFPAFLEQVQSMPGEEDSDLLERYKAEAYRQLNQTEKMKAVFKENLEKKDPDLRILYIMETRFPELKSEARAKRDELVSFSIPGERWWRKGHEQSSTLSERARIGIPLQLKPGFLTVRVRMRSRPSETGYHGYVIFRLFDGDQEQIIGEKLVKSSEWQEYEFPITVNGGKRWFEAELYNGTEKGKSLKDFKGPSVDFSEVRIIERK